jgi:hypothetical protein
VTHHAGAVAANPFNLRTVAIMAKPKNTSFHSGKRFLELSGGEKLRFIGKALVFAASGGFIFPTMWTD